MRTPLSDIDSTSIRIFKTLLSKMGGHHGAWRSALRVMVSVCAAVALATAGCTQLPAAGPSAAAIEAKSEDVSTLNYTVVDVDETALDVLTRRFSASLASSFGGSRRGGPEALGVGDEVEVTIWEAANGGLFSTSSGALGGGSKSTIIPAQPVSSAGVISIPYAGSIQAAGRTPTEVKGAIETALAGKAIEPQALVTVKRSASNRVTVMGDAARGGIVQVPAGGLRLLDAVAGSGGFNAPTEEIMVELVRGGSTTRVPMTRIISDPRENIYVRPDDVIALLRSPQSFTTFGATGANALVRFPVTGIKLDEAVARVGGLLDYRADPAGVFVFRYEQPAVVRALGASDAEIRTSDGIPVVYRLDLRDPKGLFRAKRFDVADGDLVYVANANLNELQKFVALVTTVTQPPLAVGRTLDAF